MGSLTETFISRGEASVGRGSKPPLSGVGDASKGSSNGRNGSWAYPWTKGKIKRADTKKRVLVYVKFIIM